MYYKNILAHYIKVPPFLPLSHDQKFVVGFLVGSVSSLNGISCSEAVVLLPVLKATNPVKHQKHLGNWEGRRKVV
jgi:hypothetical protein